MDRRVRVLVLTSTWPLRPNDPRTTFVRDLCRDMSNRGYLFEVVAPHSQGAATSEHDGEVMVHRFRYMFPARLQSLAYGGGGLVNYRSARGKLQVIPFLLAEILSTYSVAQRFRPALIHAHWLLPQGFAALLVKKLLGIPYVVTVHGGDVFGLRSPIFTWFKKVAARGAAAITVNGELTRKAVAELGIDPKMISVIRMAPAFEGMPDPAAVRKWRDRFPSDATIVLFVGRLVAEKGAADLLNALAILRRNDIWGVICGDGPLRQELVALSQRLGLSDRVSFEGWLEPSDIACRMAGADALVFPSRRAPDGWTEAQGVVLIEAMRADLPIFAANTGGIPDIVSHERTGWLFPQGDTEALAALISSLADDQLPNVSGVIENARERAQELATRDQTADAFQNLFKEVVMDSCDQKPANLRRKVH